MAKNDFYDPIDLHQKELLNVRLQALLNLPENPFEGQICYHSINNKKAGALYNGSNWLYFGVHNLMSDLQGGLPKTETEPAQYNHLSNDELLILQELGENFVTLDTEQEITGKKIFNADLIVGDPSLDYLGWSKVAKTFSIFSQAQFIHKYRGGSAGALNIGQFDVNGNASINNTSNAGISIGTNNIQRIGIEANGDVLLKKVDNGVGDFVRINASTGKLTKRTVAEVQEEVGGGGGGTLSTGTSPVLTDSGGGATYTSSGAYKLLETSTYFRLSFTVSINGISGTPSGKLQITGLPTMTGALASFSSGKILSWIDGSTYANKPELYPVWASATNHIGFLRIQLNVTEDALSISSGVISGYITLYK